MLLDIIICNTNPKNKQLYYSLIILFHISEENQIYEYVLYVADIGGYCIWSLKICMKIYM